MLWMETIFFGLNGEVRMDVMEETGECLRIWSEIMADLRSHEKKNTYICCIRFDSDCFL